MLDPLKEPIGSRPIGLTDNDARFLIYRAFVEKAIKGAPCALMYAVHDNYFHPKHEVFRARTV